VNKVIIDASVAVKWFVNEARHDLARRLLEAEVDHCMPDLGLIEVANAFRNKVRNGEMSAAQAQDAMENLPDLLAAVLPSGALVRRAFQLGVTLNHPVADCVYIALAESVGGLLITDDRKLISKAASVQPALQVRALADFMSSQDGPE
jgi:predicted nucleic acid-binding protein